MFRTRTVGSLHFCDGENHQGLTYLLGTASMEPVVVEGELGEDAVLSGLSGSEASVCSGFQWCFNGVSWFWVVLSGVSWLSWVLRVAYSGSVHVVLVVFRVLDLFFGSCQYFLIKQVHFWKTKRTYLLFAGVHRLPLSLLSCLSSFKVFCHSQTPEKNKKTTTDFATSKWCRFCLHSVQDLLVHRVHTI